MKIRNRKTMARLASLSAAGAGALGLAAGQAHASVITGGNLTTVGYYGGDVASYTLGSFGASSENIATAAPGGFLGSQVYRLEANGPLTFRGQPGNHFSFVAAGKTWNQGRGFLRNATFAFRQFTRTTHFTRGYPVYSHARVKTPYTGQYSRNGYKTLGSTAPHDGGYQYHTITGNQTGTRGGHYVTSTFGANAAGGTPPDTGYVLFRFQNGSTTDYGWLQIAVTVSAGYNSGAYGPNATITGWAYSTSGDPLPAGALSDVPEPGTFYETGLAALALGAVGLRRWRKTRKQES